MRVRLKIFKSPGAFSFCERHQNAIIHGAFSTSHFLYRDLVSYDSTFRSNASVTLT